MKEMSSLCDHKELQLMIFVQTSIVCSSGKTVQRKWQYISQYLSITGDIQALGLHKNELL